MHQSDSSVKEHLIDRINEQDKVIMEKGAELLFAKKKIQEMLNDKIEVDQIKEEAVRYCN